MFYNKVEVKLLDYTKVKSLVADQFIPAQLELEDGIIKEIYPYNEKEVTKDYGDLRILPWFY